MTRLRSDQSLRDRWLELSGIETGKFKTASFVPQRATGLPATWKATAERSGRDLTGSATTLVHWADFDVGKTQAD